MALIYLRSYSKPLLSLVLLQILCQVPSVISGFNCTKKGYFPDSQDSSKFYSCLSDSGPALSYNCRKKQVYNATLGSCEDPSITEAPTVFTTTTEITPTKPHLTEHSHKCSLKHLTGMVQCFKNKSNSWKKSLKSIDSPNDVAEVLKKALNNTDEIFSAFDKQRNSTQDFNVFNVLKILDDIGQDVANKTGDTIVVVSNYNILVEISRIRLPYRFPNYSHNASHLKRFKDVRDVIHFPEGLFNDSTDHYAVSTLYLGLTDKLPTRLFKSNKSHVINSHVISSLVVPDLPVPFESNIMIILKHFKVLGEGDYSVCAYWDYALQTYQGYGAWSREGCHVMTGRSNKTHTTCSCNHLTNFAILMGSESIPITELHEFALSVITYVGCALSLFGAVAAIAILVVLTTGLHSDRNIIHANLLISIAISQTVFLAGVEQTQDRTLCKFTAVMLHYFYLVSFAWMLCEGFHLYAMVIKVFNLQSRVYHYVAFAWGIPAVVVLVTVVCRFKEYGTPTSCWISTEYYTLLAFILPVALTLLINIVILCLVMREICKLHVTESSHIKKMINSTFKTVAVLFPLLGITWIFGLLLFVTQEIMFQYLFAVFNSLQGFFIFVLHCLFNSEIRKNFKRKKEVWKSLRAFENVRRRITISIIPVRSPVTKATTASNERAETFEKSS